MNEIILSTIYVIITIITSTIAKQAVNALDVMLCHSLLILLTETYRCKYPQKSLTNHLNKRKHPYP